MNNITILVEVNEENTIEVDVAGFEDQEQAQFYAAQIMQHIQLTLYNSEVKH